MPVTRCSISSGTNPGHWAIVGRRTHKFVSGMRVDQRAVRERCQHLPPEDRRGFSGPTPVMSRNALMLMGVPTCSAHQFVYIDVTAHPLSLIANTMSRAYVRYRTQIAVRQVSFRSMYSPHILFMATEQFAPLSFIANTWHAYVRSRTQTGPHKSSGA